VGPLIGGALAQKVGWSVCYAFQAQYPILMVLLVVLLDYGPGIVFCHDRGYFCVTVETCRRRDP